MTADAVADRPVDCPLCGGRETTFDSTHRDHRKGLDGSWRFWRCRPCGVVFQHPMPTPDELRTFYAGYSPAVHVPFEGGAGTRHPRLRRLYHWLTGDEDPRDFVRVAPGARVLDFGCGEAPYFLDFHARGVVAEGAEVSAEVVRQYRDRGFDVRQIEDLEVIPFDAERFDAVYLMQVIEHVRQPHRMFAELHRVTRPGGHVYLALPNGRSLWRRVFGAAWVSGWFAPFHLFVYTAEALGRVAAGHGFEVVRSWSTTPESWWRLDLRAAFAPSERRLEYIRGRVVDARPVRVALMLVLRAVELLLPERDCLVVQLRRLPTAGGTG